MFNFTGKYVKVWNVEVKEKMVLVDLSVSKKNKDNTYTNSSYKKCKFIGKQLDEAKTLAKGDTINITNGMIGKREYEGKYYDDVVVFDFEVTNKKEQDSIGDFTNIEDNDDPIPF